MKVKQLIYLLGCFLLLNCSGNQVNDKSKHSTIEEEKFDAFMSHFYSDSIFQSSRIIRPLEGGMMNSETGFEKWENNISSIPSKNDLSESFPEFNLKSENIKLDTIIIEKVWQENSGFKVEKHFVYRNGKWYLKKMNFIYL
jgi:hypothetical protein